MNFFGITELENETNRDAELALRKSMRAKLKIPLSTKKTYILAVSIELCRTAHSQMTEILTCGRLYLS